MHILFVSNLYPPNVVGGYEQLCAGVAAALASRGHDVTVLTSSFGGKEATYPSQTVHRSLQLLVGDGIYQPFAGEAAERARINAENIAITKRLILTERPDVIFSWNLFFFDLSLLDALASSGIPVAVMLTDNWLINMHEPQYVADFFRDHVFGGVPFPPALPPPSGFIERLRGWMRLTAATPPPAPGRQLPYAAVFGAEFVRTLHHVAGFRFAREEVIHNGVHQHPRPASMYRDRRYPVAAGELRLLFAGRLVDLKGAHTAVQALSLINQLQPDAVRLTIVGDTKDAAYQRQLQEEIARAGIADQISMREPVPEDALFDLFQAHDIYLFPSLYEPFSLTLIHALANGIPTVASDAGGNVEIVRHQETGMLFPKGDADGLARSVVTLASNPDLRARIAEHGREVAAGFTFDKMATRMEQLLKGLQ
jgi:glycogen(starch) synthase